MAADPDPYEVVRSVLEAEGWSVSRRRKKGLFEAEQEDRRLTAVIASGLTPDQSAGPPQACGRRLAGPKAAIEDLDRSAGSRTAAPVGRATDRRRRWR